MQNKNIFILLFVFLFLGEGVISAQSRVVFFRKYVPGSDDVFKHKIKITYSHEGQYARPHTTYTDKYILIGKLGRRSLLVYDYFAPTPEFYVGKDTRHMVTPDSAIQFVRVSDRFSFFKPRYRFTTYTAEQFKYLYDHKSWLRRKLLSRGYASIADLRKIAPPVQE